MLQFNQATVSIVMSMHYLLQIMMKYRNERIYPNPVDGNYVTIQSPAQGLKEIEVFTS